MCTTHGTIIFPYGMKDRVWQGGEEIISGSTAACICAPCNLKREVGKPAGWVPLNAKKNPPAEREIPCPGRDISATDARRTGSVMEERGAGVPQQHQADANSICKINKAKPGRRYPFCSTASCTFASCSSSSLSESTKDASGPWTTSPCRSIHTAGAVVAAAATASAKAAVPGG